MPSPLRILAILTLLLSTLPARAQAAKPDASEARGAESAVAAGRPERVFDSPRDVSVVDGKRAKERSLADLPSLLDEAPGLSLQWPRASAAIPALRGQVGRAVAVFLDDIRLSHALTPLAGGDGLAHPLAMVDLFSLQGVDVLRGASPVLHSADALAGVVTLRRHPLRFDPWRAWDASGGAYGLFSSAATGLLGHAFAEGHLRGFGLRISGSALRADDLVAGRGIGEQPFTRFANGTLDLHGAWYISQKTTLRLSYSTFRRHDAPRAARSSARDFSLLRDELRDLVALRFRRESDSRWLRELWAQISLVHQRQQNERLELDADRLSRHRDGVLSIGARVRGRSELPGNNSLVYGVDFQHDRVDSTAEQERISEPLRSPLPRGRYLDGSSLSEFAVYARDRLQLLDKRLLLDLGLRFTSWFSELPVDGPRAAQSSALHDLSGSLHARYLLGDGLNLHAGLSRAVRAPNLDDLTVRGCSDQGFESLPGQLDKERSLAAEAGLRVDLFGMLRGGVSYAFTYLDRPLVRRLVPGDASQRCGRQLLPLTRRDNGERAHVHSLEADLRLSLGAHVSLFAWISWAHGAVKLNDDDDDSQALGRVPPLQGLAGVRYESRGRYFAELAVRWALRQDRLAPLDRSDTRICTDAAVGCQAPAGYALVRIRGGLKLFEGLRLSLAVSNVANEPYRSHGSGIDGAGLDVRTALELAL